MSVLLFGNNDETTIASPIGSTDTSVTLVSTTGWQTPSAGQYFVMSFFDASTGLITEIVHVTALVSNVATIVRGQEGTAAVAWNAGDHALNAWTAGQAAAMQQTAQAQGQQANSANDSGIVNAYVADLSPAPTVRVAGMPVRLLAILNANTGASTLDVGLGPSPIKAPDGSALIGGELLVGSDAEFLDGVTFYQFSPVLATTTRAGTVPLATNAQAATGTDTKHAMTPASSASVTSLLAPKASPALTGVPTVPTAAPGTNTTQAASTAFVQSAIGLLPFSNLYSTGEQAISLGSQIGPFNQDFPIIGWSAYLVCTIADGAFSVGWVAPAPILLHFSSEDRGINITGLTSTHFYVDVGPNGLVVYDGSVNPYTITPTSWKYIIYVWG